MGMLRGSSARRVMMWAVVGAAGGVTSWAWGDITRWDNGQVIAGTVGITPGPGVNLSNLTLEYAAFSNLQLTNANFDSADLFFAHFVQADASNASFRGASLIAANCTMFNANGCDLQDTNLMETVLAGATLTNCDLVGSAWSETIITGANFNGANLSGVALTTLDASNATFIGANLAGAAINLEGKGIDFSDSNLSNIILDRGFSGGNLSFANLSGALFHSADLSNCTITGANFSNSTVSYSEIAATTNFSVRNLVNINLSNVSMPQSNFSGEDLAYSNLTKTSLQSSNFSNAFLAKTRLAGATITSCDFSNATLTGADLSGGNLSFSNLTNSTFWAAGLMNATLSGAVFANADFSDADVRGAHGWLPASATITNNMILTDGSIAGLSMSNGEELIVRNYPMAITAKTTAKFVAGSTIDFVLDGNAWGSTISFGTGVVPALDGTIELDLAAGVDPSSNIGRSYTLFNWGAGLAAGDQFASIVANAPAGYTWDTSHLYRTGVVTLWAVPEGGTVGILGLMGGVLLRRRRRRG